jgi:hypothetical protein
MLALIQFHLVTLLVALLIGVVTGRWMFAHRRSGPATKKPEDSPKP